MAGNHLINRVTVLGTGLIGGSFALALRKYTTGHARRRLGPRDVGPRSANSRR